MNIQQYQRKILQMSYNLERISILQKKSRTRLQIIHRNGKCYIRSINDKHKNIRIILLGLIVNIFRTKNIQQLNKLKQIIYQSQLEGLTTCQGLLKQSLHSIIAINFLRLQEEENIQNELIKCFNCTAFFDQVILQSLREYFFTNQYQQYEIWSQIISQTFQVRVKLLQILSKTQIQFLQQNTLIFQKDGQSIYLSSDSKYLMDDDFSDENLRKIQNKAGTGNHIDKLLTISIDCFQSPNIDKQNCNNQNLSHKKEKVSAFEAKQQVKRSRKNKTSIWSIFCCGVD